jgi:hypothetical protein
MACIPPSQWNNGQRTFFSRAVEVRGFRGTSRITSEPISSRRVATDLPVIDRRLLVLKGMMIMI